MKTIVKGIMRTAAKLFTVFATLAATCTEPAISHALVCLDCIGDGGGSGGSSSAIGTLSGCVTATEARVNPATPDTGLDLTPR
jgi:hypothetical protein